MEPAKSTDEPKAQAPAAPEAAGEQSKKGAKKAAAKAAKEAEKARKAAEREAAQKAQGGGANTEDLAKDNYGAIPKLGKKLDAPWVDLHEIGEEHLGKTIQIRGWIQNARMQGAKMAFIELRKRGDWSIQGVVAANPENTPVSKQMVKWIGGLKLESLVLLEAKVQKPLEPVKSTRVSGYELHLTKCYLVAAAPEVLGMSLATASIAVGSVEEGDEGVTEALEGKITVS